MEILELAKALSELTAEEQRLLSSVLQNNFGMTTEMFSQPVGTAPIVRPYNITEVDVILKRVGDRKLGVIKTIKEMFGLGLRDAKRVADEAPFTLAENETLERAEEIKKILEEVGATIEFK